ncbi:MAG TPA: ABC transporter permease [Acidimicrobiia bacterium]|nr:ABC transporter permease [Acidimicrobiia bacterium]
MTTTQATMLVAGRELREAFRRKSIWIVIAIIFVGSTVGMILPGALDSGTNRYDVAVVTDGQAALVTSFESALEASRHALDADLRFVDVETAERARSLVDDRKVDVAVVAGNRPEVIVRSGENATLVAFVRQALASTALQRNLAGAGLSPGQIANVLRISPPRVSQVAAGESDRRSSAAILSLVLYLLLLMLMIQAANGVAIEKANRISEVLLAVVRPSSLLFGKVIGVGIVGLASLLAGAVPVVVKVAVGGDLPAGLGPAVAASAAWLVLGLVLFLTIAGALGALVERQEETGTAVAPLSLLIVATYILAQSAADQGLGRFLSIFPLTSPIVMPTRIALGDASALDIVASLVLGVATVFVVVRVGAAIYRRGIVHTGRRLRLAEALRSP